MNLWISSTVDRLFFSLKNGQIREVLGGSDPAIHKLQGIAVRGIPTPLKNIGQLG